MVCEQLPANERQERVEWVRGFEQAAQQRVANHTQLA